MKSIIKVFFLLSIFILILSPEIGHCQNQDSVLRKEFKEFRKSIKDSIAQIEKKVKLSEETLKAAKEYSENATNLTNLYLTIIGAILAISGILLGGILAFLYQYIKSRYEKRLEKNLEKYEKQIDRLIRTEEKTIYIKENAYILFVHKTNLHEEENELTKLQKVVFQEFENKDEIKVSSFEALMQNHRFKKFLERNSPAKAIVLNDDLFIDLSGDGGQIRNKEYSDDSKRIVENLFSLLNSKKIGLMLFGNAGFRSFNVHLKYKGFSNEPYTIYNNLNVLLKYMYVVNKNED